MSSAIEIVVIDEENGNKIETASIKLDESVFDQEYAVVQDLDKAEPGRKYIIRASIDLGPFLGEALCEEKVAVPSGS
jgi:hypothetical protein